MVKQTGDHVTRIEFAFPSPCRGCAKPSQPIGDDLYLILCFYYVTNVEILTTTGGGPPYGVWHIRRRSGFVRHFVYIYIYTYIYTQFLHVYTRISTCLQIYIYVYVYIYIIYVYLSTCIPPK